MTIGIFSCLYDYKILAVAYLYIYIYTARLYRYKLSVNTSIMLRFYVNWWYLQFVMLLYEELTKRKAKTAHLIS